MINVLYMKSTHAEQVLRSGGKDEVFDEVT